MKRIGRFLAIATIAIVPGVLSAQTLECQGTALNVKAAALSTPRTGSLVNFTGSGGQLDPLPLLEMNVTISGAPALPAQRPACITLTFSVQVDPSDNYSVFQASIDDVPMSGHGTLYPEYGYTTPIVFDAVNQGSFIPNPGAGFPNPANSRIVSYTFFASVMPGTRTIRIRLAGCCSPVPAGASLFVRAATLIARW
jgi:hypothetical protein